MDFIDLQEVDLEDAIMILLSQTFIGEVKKWFKTLITGSIPGFQQFQDVFLRKREIKKNSLQLLTQYNNLKRIPMENVQEFYINFTRSYNSILAHVKPPPRATQLHYASAFDNDFDLALRERRSTNLAYMMNDVMEVEVNLMASRKLKHKLDSERKMDKEESQPSSSHTFDAKFDSMMKTMEKLMEILAIGDGPRIRQQHETQIRNPNFRRPPFPQIRQRDQRNPTHNQIRPPFQKNIVAEELEDTKDHIHCVDKGESKFYITQEDNDKSCQYLNVDFEIPENEDYERGYQNAILEFRKQYNLKNRKGVVNTNKSHVDQHSSSQIKKAPPRKKEQNKDEYKVEKSLKKIQEEKDEVEA